MEKRTKEFLIVSFYLSKFGRIKDGKKYPLPPSRLKTNDWVEAYRIFYDRLGGNRTILTFERSLKNARDSFDSHLPDSKRIGWLEGNKKPNPLSEDAKKIFDDLAYKSEEEVWQLISQYADINVIEYKQIVNDEIAVQESEVEYKITRTEGGVKTIISNTYERKLSNKNDAIKIHGVNCSVCNFNFEENYGSWGKNYIEVHHIQALADGKGVAKDVNPTTDLIVLCANCHRMVHRKKGITLTVEELKDKLSKRKT